MSTPEVITAAPAAPAVVAVQTKAATTEADVKVAEASQANFMLKEILRQRSDDSAAINQATRDLINALVRENKTLRNELSQAATDAYERGRKDAEAFREAQIKALKDERDTAIKAHTDLLESQGQWRDAVQEAAAAEAELMAAEHLKAAYTERDNARTSANARAQECEALKAELMAVKEAQNTAAELRVNEALRVQAGRHGKKVRAMTEDHQKEIEKLQTEHNDREKAGANKIAALNAEIARLFREIDALKSEKEDLASSIEDTVGAAKAECGRAAQRAEHALNEKIRGLEAELQAFYTQLDTFAALKRPCTQ